MKRINWVTAVFLFSTPVGALVWGGFHVHANGVSAAEVIFFAFYLVITAMSITAGYHRLFSHRAYEASPLVRALYLLFGAATFQDSALAWSADHRSHHQNIDREGDPYNVHRGFLWAHMGWLLVTDHLHERRTNVPDLEGDWMVVAQDRYYGLIATVMCFGLPLLVGFAFGDPWGFLLWGGLVRVVVGHHITFLVNSLAHTLGERPYEPAFSARDSLVTAVLTFGEGYHNFHHRFASDYRNGVRRYQWDPTKWLIRGLEKIGLASNLRRVPRERIVAARMRSDEHRLLERVRECSQDAVESAQARLAEISVAVERTVTRLGELEREFARVRTDAAGVSRERLRQLQADLRAARKEFREAWRRWARELSRLPASLEPSPTAG
ncbi:MAG: fatty acid desaturase [Candidatus Binatia bacterium]|nr:fatty acid desaturase [Candidatus Binatia bacterium]